jgi:ABC-2 type transport system permease protein
MRRTVTSNLLGNDPVRIDRFWNVMDLQTRALAPSEKRDIDDPLTFYLPYGTAMVFYILIIMSASLLLSSVTVEKQNRVAEILMLSVSPRQLLGGKIIGLGLTGLLQSAIWVGTGYTLLRLSGRRLALPPSVQLPPAILAWAIVFFLLGYAVYASLMAGLGALVPNMKEASQATIVVIWPTLIPLFLIVPLIERPHAALATGLSLFPLTAPIVMMLRLSIGGVAPWQPPVAAGLMLIVSYLIIRAVSDVFRAQNLLSGQPFSVRRYYRALVTRS